MICKNRLAGGEGGTFGFVIRLETCRFGGFFLALGFGVLFFQDVRGLCTVRSKDN